MAYADKERLTSLAQGIRDRLLIKDKTEAQALVLSVTYPNCIYYTSDTHCIIVAGHVYGRSNQVSADAPFAYLPASEPSPAADPQFSGNHDTIYIQPIKTGADAGKIKLWWYVNNTWVSSDTLDLVLPTDAEDITYDLTNTPDLGSGDVQSAVEALDGKVEELRDEVLGDEWVDEIFGRKADWIRQYCYSNWNGTIGYSGYSDCYGFEIKAGDTFHFIDRRHSMYPMWLAYTEYKDLTGSNAYSGTMPTVVSDECDPDNIGQNARVVDHVQTFSSETKMVIVIIEHNADWYQRITSNRGTPLSIADKTGYKIDTWTDDEIITSTSLAVGSVVPYWSDGTRYGGRGVRLNVKEGDKVLLDTYSPALFGLIFTDENRVVKALYDDRRFDGVWTAPCNGYCYIQDVLYRDNFHYASAHGHLAYMAHDARKRVAKGGDWYNEYAPRILGDCLCEVDFEASSGMRYVASLDGSQVGSKILETSRNAYKFTLHASYIKFFADNEASGVVNNHSWGSNNVAVNNIKSLTFTAGVESEGWTVAITRSNGDYFNAVYGAYFSLSARAHLHAQYIKTFLHSSYDYAELYRLANKIINGEVEVDNFYGVREKEVDLVKNAIGLQSISDLGYNILDHGATLPIDEEGYKYAKEIYERYKDNPPTGNIRDLFANDQKLVYFPNIDLSNATTIGGNTSSGLFFNCRNLQVIPPLNLTGTASMAYCLQHAFSIKRIDSIGSIKVTAMSNFAVNGYSLEYVGKIDTSECYGFWGFLAYCYSLKRIEELDIGKVSQWGSNGTVAWPNAINIEYMLLKNLCRLPSQTAHSFVNTPKWGINSDENPDARQSLVDSLLTYSYDRVNDPDNLGTAGTTCTITLSANSYAQLTTSEIEAITAKGYTLTHP